MVTAMAAAHQTTARVVADQDALQQTIGGVELGASRPSQRPAQLAGRRGGAAGSAAADCRLPDSGALQARLARSVG